MSHRMQVTGRPTERSGVPERIDADMQYGDGIEVQPKQAIDVRPAARAEGDSIAFDLDDDDIIEFTTSDGWVDVTRAGHVAERQRARRGPGAGRIDLADELVDTAAQRGGRDVTSIQAYAARIPEVIREQLTIIESIAETAIDLAADPVARAAAGRVLRWLERTVPDEEIGPEHVGKTKRHGVYRLETSLELTAARRLGPGDTLPEGRSLLLAHGTFSSTEGGFLPLQGTGEWERIVDHYDGQVFALEHPTLSVSPVGNAVGLAEHLPSRGELDVVSHSRGGLVGDLLSLGAAGLVDPGSHQRADAAWEATEGRGRTGLGTH